MKTQQIVVAWIDQGTPRAAMWLRYGDEADEAKAQEYVQAMGGRSFAYPQSEQEPLPRARREIMEAKS